MKLQLIYFVFFLAIFSQRVFSQDQDNAFIPDEKYVKEVKKLLKKKKIQDAFEYIDILEPRTLKDLVYLTEIPAPPFEEEKRAEAFRDLLDEAGADKVWIDEVGNVIAVRKAAKRDSERPVVVVLDAHLDTVFPEGTDVTIKFNGDTLIAPGIGDNTRGLVLILTVLRALNESGIATVADIWIVGTVGEEGLGDLRGVKHLFRPGAPAIRSWISVDGGSTDRITNSGLGSHRYRVTFTGEGGHSWGAFGMANPIHALGRAINIFVTEADGFIQSGPKTSYNVGRIGGGISVNSISFESWMEVDMRSVEHSSLLAMDDIFQKAMQAALQKENDLRKNGEALNVKIEMIGDRPSGEVPVDIPLIQRALAVATLFNISPRLTTGSTNSNIPISRGIPAVTISRGGKGGGSHALKEWWLNDSSGPQAIKLALLLLVTEAGMK